MSLLILALWIAAPGANWQRAATVPISTRQYVRLSLGDVTLYNGAAGPGELRLWLQPVTPSPPPLPPVPGPPGPPRAAPIQVTGFLGPHGQPIGRVYEGYRQIDLGAARIGQEAAVTGAGFGTRPGKIWLGVVEQAVLEWTDRRIRFLVIEPGLGRDEATFSLRTADGRGTTGKGFTVER